MQGNKWESSTDATSIPGSSPPRSPFNRPTPKHRPDPSSGFYFVQSPSLFDGDNKSSLSLSLHSSPPASPRHHLDHASRRHPKSHPSAGKGGAPPWSNTFGAIHEEDAGTYPPHHPYQHPADRLSARVRLLIFFVVFCGALFGLLILLIWAITKPSAPQVSIKNVVFHDVYIGPGEDASGVPTNLITANCTVQIDFINTSKYLKAHLQPLQLELLYLKLSIAIHKVDNYTQSQKSHKVVLVQLRAVKVPLYGASHELANSPESINQGNNLPLRMTTSVRSKFYVASRIVTSSFWTQIKCNIDVNTKSLALLSPISNSCTQLD